MPRLELCAAVIGVHLATMVRQEITLPIYKTTFWSDSTTVLQWLHYDSCRYKVFVGTQIAERMKIKSNRSAF